MSGNALKLMISAARQSSGGGKLAPSAQWGVTGNAGSGFGTANPGVPTDPSRTTAKPWCTPLFVNWQTVTGDIQVVFDAGAVGGLSGVVFWLEGNSLSGVEKLWSYTDANGAARTIYGYGVTLDYATWIGLNSNGTANLYAVATPVDGTMQARCVGPYTFYARTSEFDITKTVGASGADYTTINGALAYAYAHRPGTATPQRVRVLLKDTADYPITAQASTFYVAGWWTVIEADAGVTATIGDYSLQFTQPGYDGLCFRNGAGTLKWDLAKMSFVVNSAYRWSGTGQSTNRLWCNGIEIFCGTPNASKGGSGSGANTLYNGGQPFQYWIAGNDSDTLWNLFFTEVYAHDLPGYGLSFFKLRRNCITDTVSGSDCENNNGAVHGGYSNKIGGYYSGLGTFTPAFDLTYSGGSTMAYEKTGANGHTGSFNIYIPASASTPTYTYSLNGGASGTMANLVDWINLTVAAPGLSATLTTAANLLDDTYLSRADLAPSSAIPKTTLSGTVSLKRIADIHADVLVNHGGSGSSPYTQENRAARFFENRNSVGTAFCSINGSANGPVAAQDWGYRNLSNQDISTSLSSATQPGYWGGYSQSHVMLQYASSTNPSGIVVYDATMDSYCRVDHYAGVVGWSSTPGAAGILTNNFVPLSSLPANSDSNSKASAIAFTAMFTAPNSAPPNFVPLSAIQLNDLSYPGRYRTNGTEQGI